MTAAPVGRPGSPARRRPPGTWAAGALGVVILALVIADVPLAGLAHQALDSSGGSLPIWVSLGFGVAGLVVALRKPGNPLGWVLIGVAAFGALSQDASFYTVADYRLRHGDLPFGWVGLLAQPGWAPTIVLLGVTVLLFPDGRPPSPRLRWLLWAYAAVALLWIVSAMTITLGAVIGHRIRVDPSGNLLQFDASSHLGWWNVVSNVFFALLAICWLLSLGGQAFSYRRSSGMRRGQLKWVMTGSIVAAAGLVFAFSVSGGQTGALRVLADLAGAATFLALPASIGVAIMRYRLFDIDRVISRTLAYAIVTGLLVGVYAGLILLATQVLRFHTAIAVAASTLAAAALFSPVRRRVQRAVDRRFNRARYDADQTIAAFAARIKEAVDQDAVRDDLLGTVHRALEPTGAWIWIAGGRRRGLPGPIFAERAPDLAPSRTCRSDPGTAAHETACSSSPDGSGRTRDS